MTIEKLLCVSGFVWAFCVGIGQSSFNKRRMMTINQFTKIAEIVDAEKQNLGHNFGHLFKTEVRVMLAESGYKKKILR